MRFDNEDLHGKVERENGSQRYVSRGFWIYCAELTRNITSAAFGSRAELKSTTSAWSSFMDKTFIERRHYRKSCVEPVETIAAVHFVLLGRRRMVSFGIQYDPISECLKSIQSAINLKVALLQPRTSQSTWTYFAYFSCWSGSSFNSTIYVTTIHSFSCTSSSILSKSLCSIARVISFIRTWKALRRT